MKLERKQQILVRRRAAIGDTIMSTGVVRELKHKFGDNADIHVATEFMEVYTNNPHIKSIYHTDHMPSADQFDLYINLDDAYEWNPTIHYVDNYFYRAFGSTDYDEWYYKDLEYTVERIEKILKDRRLVSADSDRLQKLIQYANIRRMNEQELLAILKTWRRANGLSQERLAAQAFAEVMLQRRSVRMFSDRPVERATIEWLIRAAQSAPSGAISTSGTKRPP